MKLSAATISTFRTPDSLNDLLPLKKWEDIDIATPSLVRCRVSSAIAAEMLGLNIKNRRPRKAAVDYLRRQIANGEWREDHPQPVVFSRAGRLIDGQHRLMAISQSEIPDSLALMLRVETGAADDVREYMDTGVPRTLDDRIELHPEHEINKLLAQLCSYAWIDRLAATDRTRFNAKRPSPDDFKEWFSQHRDAAIAISRMHKRDRGVGKIQIAYAAMEYWEINQLKAEAFYSSLFMADGPVQPARMLRDWVLRTIAVRSARINEGTTARSEVYRRSVYCMKAHLRNKTIASVREATWK